MNPKRCLLLQHAETKNDNTCAYTTMTKALYAFRKCVQPSSIGRFLAVRGYTQVQKFSEQSISEKNEVPSHSKQWPSNHNALWVHSRMNTTLFI